MPAFIQDLMNGLLDKVLIDYTTQSGAKIGMGIMYDEQLAHKKRECASDLVKDIKNIQDSSLLQLTAKKKFDEVDWFQLYKDAALKLINADEKKVQELCNEFNASLGIYTRFLANLRFTLNALPDVIKVYDIKSYELFKDISTDARLGLVKTFMEYELEKSLLNKIKENSICQTLVNKLSNPDKYQAKVKIIRTISKDMSDALSLHNNTATRQYKKIVLTYVERAMLEEETVQKSIKGTSDSGSYLKKISNTAFSVSSLLSQKTYDIFRTTKLSQKLKKYHDELLKILADKSFYYSP